MVAFSLFRFVGVRFTLLVIVVVLLAWVQALWLHVFIRFLVDWFVCLLVWFVAVGLWIVLVVRLLSWVFAYLVCTCCCWLSAGFCWFVVFSPVGVWCLNIV